MSHENLPCRAWKAVALKIALRTKKLLYSLGARLASKRLKKAVAVCPFRMGSLQDNE